MATAPVDSRTLTLSQILMALAHWTSGKPKAARVTTPPLHCLPTELLCLHCTFFWPVHSCMFSVWSLVCVARLVTQCSLSFSLSLSGFTQPKPWQQYWLRGLCIPLGWWRGLSSVRSLRPGADRSFTSTSLSNTPLDMRQHPPKRSAGGTHTHWQTSLLLAQYTHTDSEQREKGRLGHFVANFSLSILYPFLTIANRVQCTRRGDKRRLEKNKGLD